MDGVTILNTYMEWTKSETALLLFTGLIGATLITLLIVWGASENAWGYFFAMLLLATLICFISYYPKTEHIQATIDDTVSWVELTDKYEIVKSDGRIITMIEKERKDNETSNDI